MELTNKLSKNPDVTVLHKEDQVLFINKNNKSWLRTNNSGKSIFDDCDGNRTMNDVLQSNAKKYGISSSLIKDSIEAFVGQCLEKGILFENGHRPQSSEESVTSEEPHFIEEVFVELTTNCQLDCVYCPYRKSLRVPHKTMSQDHFGDLIRKISALNPTNIILTGGEPLLREDLPDICRLSKESGHRTTLFTNLAIGDEALFKTLIKYVDRIFISIDGTDETVHDKIRGKGSFLETISRLKLLKSLGFEELYMVHSPNRANFESSLEMVVFAMKFKMKELEISRLFPMNHGMNGTTLLSSKEFAHLYDQLREKYNELIGQELDRSVTRGVAINFMLLKATGIDTTRALFDGSPGHSDGMGVSKLSIDVDGNMYPSRFLHYPEFKVGNVFSENFQDVYQNSLKRYLSLKETPLEECRDCYLETFCDKGCRASRYYNGENINKKDVLCETIFKELETVLWTSKLLK